MFVPLLLSLSKSIYFKLLIVYISKVIVAKTAILMVVHQGKDFHDDNKFEEKAEKWARKEYSRKWSQKFK